METKDVSIALILISATISIYLAFTVGHYYLLRTSFWFIPIAYVVIIVVALLWKWERIINHISSLLQKLEKL